MRTCHHRRDRRDCHGGRVELWCSHAASGTHDNEIARGKLHVHQRSRLLLKGHLMQLHHSDRRCHCCSSSVHQSHVHRGRVLQELLVKMKRLDVTWGDRAAFQGGGWWVDDSKTSHIEEGADLRWQL